MNRKASLSLSINAIVILVLAITMLGLGLAFTKGMFGKLSSKLTVPEPDIPATAEEPIVLPSDEMSMTKNKEFIFSVNAYNDDFSGDVTGTLNCVADSTSGAGVLTVKSAAQEIPAGDDKGFKFIVPKTDLTVTSTRVCTLTFVDSSNTKTSKQVVVAIK